MKPSVLSIIFASITLSAIPYCALSASSDHTEAMLKEINQHMAEMQNQINGLQNQVKTLKTELKQEKTKNQKLLAKNNKAKLYQEVHYSPNTPSHSDIKASMASYGGNHSLHPANYSAEVPFMERSIKHGYPRVSILRNEGDASQDEQSFQRKLALLFSSTPVFTSPFMGINTAFDGSNLIVNESSVNLDYRLLKQRQAFQHQLLAQGFGLPQHPIVELSGKLEGQVMYDNTRPGQQKTDIDLASAALDTFIGINPWALGFMNFQYDNSPNSSDPVRTNNSRIFLRQGFLTLGRLDQSPWYATVGQIFVPFGQYSSYFISDPLTQDLGRAKERAVVLGYKPQEGLYANAYVFKGIQDANKELEGGGTLGFNQKWGDFSVDASTGLISNLAESEGMQANGAGSNVPFSGFGQNEITERLVHSVPGMNVRSTFSYGAYNLFAEYVRAIKRFDAQDLAFGDINNLAGAEPQAFHLEGVYSFYIYGKPSSVALAWGFSKEALALLLPEQRLMAAFNYSPWIDTLATLEYRHDIGYSTNDRASGRCNTANCTATPFGPVSRSDDALTFRFGVYW